MQSTTIPRHVPAGSQLAAELSRMLRGLGYTPQGVQDVLDHVDQLGTARDSAADVADVQTIDDLVIRHTASIEADPADWPGWTDADVWELTDTIPAAGWPALAAAWEPSLEARAEWSALRDAEERIDHAIDRLEVEGRALELMTRGLEPFGMPAICGAAPTPDERPVVARLLGDDD